MRKALSLYALLLVSTTAHAGSVCVEVDSAIDNLEPKEQQAARLIMLQVFEAEGEAGSHESTDCETTYTLSNVRLGDAISVSLLGPEGRQQANALSLEGLPNLYSQMARALLSGEDRNTSSSVLTRDNVTDDQILPRRAKADQLAYVRFGYGAVGCSHCPIGPVIGMGYRYENDGIGIDISTINALIDTDDDRDLWDWLMEEDIGITGSWLRMQFIFFKSPRANNTLYLGVGPSWGGTAFRAGQTWYTEAGFQGDISVGYEFLRASTIRGMISLDSTLPFYLSNNGNQTKYAPTFALTCSFGFGKRNQTSTIRQIN